MPTTDAACESSTSQQPLQECIEQLLNEARAIAEANRAEQRESFCRPVTLTFGQGGLRRVTGFSIDISPTGIGMLHCMAVDRGEVVLTVPSASAGPIQIRSEILWCTPCRRGWYMSGARFLEVVSARSR